MLYKITIFLFPLLILSSCVLTVSSNFTLGEQVPIVKTRKGASVLECYPNDILVVGDRFTKLIKQRSHGGFTFHQIEINCSLVNAAFINDIHVLGWLKRLPDIPDGIMKVLEWIKRLIGWVLHVLIEPDSVLERVLQVIWWGLFLFFVLVKIRKFTNRPDQ